MGGTSAKVRATSRIGIFRNERTRSIPLDPKLIFWVHFILFGCIWDRFLPYNTQCKTGQLVQLFVAQSRVGIFRNERT